MKAGSVTIAKRDPVRLSPDCGNLYGHGQHTWLNTFVPVVPPTIPTNQPVSISISVDCLYPSDVPSASVIPVSSLHVTQQAPSVQKLVADSQRGIGMYLAVLNQKY